jgi:hypothetical protein
LNIGGQDRPPLLVDAVGKKIFGDCLGNIEFDSKTRLRRFDRYVVAGCGGPFRHREARKE